MMIDQHRRIADRAYFMSLAGIGADDLDRWLVAEARETPKGLVERLEALSPVKADVSLDSGARRSINAAASTSSVERRGNRHGTPFAPVPAGMPSRAEPAKKASAKPKSKAPR